MKVVNTSSCLLALVLVVFGMQIEHAKASNLPPIAVWSQYGASRPGVNIQLVNASWDPDGGNITAYKWYIDGVLVSSSSSFTFSKELAEGQNSSTFSIKLQVKDDENTWGTRISSLTISAANRTEYYLTDHLGSIRTTIDDQGNVIGYDDYYPFGLAIPGRSLNSGTPNDLNKFTGHERDQEGGLDLDYMLARNYDPEIGRFYSVDPHASRYPSWSSYTYVYNNPVNLTDPDGRDPAALYGAILGAGVEVVSQLISNGGEVSKLDKTDILIAAGAGALSHGVGPTGAVAKAAWGFGVSMVEGFLKTTTGSESESYSVEQFTSDLASSSISIVGGQVGKKIAAGSDGGLDLADDLVKANKSAGKNLGSNRLKNKALKIQSALDAHIKTGEVAGSLIGSSLQKVINGTSNIASDNNHENTTQNKSSAPPDNTRVVNR